MLTKIRGGRIFCYSVEVKIVNEDLNYINSLSSLLPNALFRPRNAKILTVAGAGLHHRSHPCSSDPCCIRRIIQVQKSKTVAQQKDGLTPQLQLWMQTCAVKLTLPGLFVTKMHLWQGLHLRPHSRSLRCSPDPLAGREKVCCPLCKNPTSAPFNLWPRFSTHSASNRPFQLQFLGTPRLY